MQETTLVLYRGKWCVYWRDEHGQPKRRSLGTADRSEALILKERFERLQQEARPKIITCREAWDLYRQSLEGRPAHATMGFEGKSILPYFGDLQSNDISPETVHGYIARRRDAGRKDGTILTELNRLAAALNHARETGRIETVPVIPRPPAPPPKDFHLTREQARAFLQAISFPHVRLFAILALTTAARATAILELLWSRVDFERRLIYLADPDARRVRVRLKGRAVVPMNDTAYAALLKAKETANGPHVIQWAGEPVKSVKKAIATAAKRSGLPDVTPHVFRHTAAVWMAEDGVPMSEISQYLGHTSTSVTERVYARFSPQYLRGAARALDLV